MKALLLSGGYGTRLRPITNTKPKCLVEVNGKPILEHWLIKLEEINCQSVLINTHYLSEQVEDFLENYNTNMQIKTTFESELLGTAGTFIKNADFFSDAQGLLIHADNYTTNKLKSFVNSINFMPKSCLLTMLTFKTENPSQCGIVETDSKGIVRNFFEKSNEFHGYKANGAIYSFNYELVSWIKNNFPFAKDFSLDILPFLKGRIFTFHIEEEFFDIGTPESLLKANNIRK